MRRISSHRDVVPEGIGTKATPKALYANSGVPMHAPHAELNDKDQLNRRPV
jgi:hypothetical protein